VDRRAGADDCVRQHCQPFASAWDAAEDGNERADGIGRDAYEDCSAALTESLLLAGIGGMAALAVSYGGARMLLMLAFPGNQRLPISFCPSMEVLWFAVCVGERIAKGPKDVKK